MLKDNQANNSWLKLSHMTELLSKVEAEEASLSHTPEDTTFKHFNEPCCSPPNRPVPLNQMNIEVVSYIFVISSYDING